MPLVLSRPGVARVEVEMQYEAGRSWREDAARILETGARFVLLAVIGLRPLISESYDLAGMTMTRVLEGVADSLPLHTLLIDLAILGSVLAWALAHGLAGRRRYRWCGLEIGLAMVVIAAVISSLWASNQRVAINASVDWISTAGLSVVLVQLLRDSRHLRLTLCVIVASGAAQAYYCFDQVFVGFEETEQVYREHREAFWEAQGVSLDAPQVELFESRLEAREASGYLSHSNIAAAHLLVAWFAMLAVLAGGWGVGRRTGEGYAGLLVGGLGALGLGWAMVLTHGLGALLAGGVGLALWAARRLARRWIDPRPGRALSFVGAMVVGGSVAVIAYGVRSGSLPGTSLSFRWDYWTAAADLVGDHLWTGVGRENFGDAYLGYKSIESPEEVQNPHNFLVAAAADWGVIGLAGVVVMLVGGAVAVAGPTLRRRGEPPPDDGADAAATARTLLPWGLLLGLVTFGVRLGLLGSDNPHYLYVATVLPGGLWLLGFGVCAIAWGDPRDTGGLRDSRMGVVLACGLFAFLLQDTINFALYVPGAATPFFGLVGVAVAARRLRGADVAPHPRARWLPAGLVGVGLAVMMVLVLVLPPVWGASEALGQARTLSYAPIDGAVEDHPAYRSYELAAEADPLDPTAPKELADWLARSAAVVSEPIPLLRLALAGIDEAIARSPSRVAFHRRRARIALSLSRWTDDPADRAAALESAARAIVLYPTRPDSLVELADLQVWVSREEGRPELSRASLDNFRRALEVDSRRPEWEEIRRFRPSRIAEIEAKIEAVEAELGEPPN